MRTTRVVPPALLLLLALLASLLAGCGPSCPAASATRVEWPTVVTSGKLRVELGANQLAQTNAQPARLPLTWSQPGAARLVVTDASGTALVQKDVPARAADTGATHHLVLADASGAPLPSGTYRVAVRVEDDEASTTLIVHCALYY